MGKEVVSGQWSVVSGQWSVVSGQWSVVSGQWSVVSGQWSVVSGQKNFERPRSQKSRIEKDGRTDVQPSKKEERMKC